IPPTRRTSRRSRKPGSTRRPRRPRRPRRRRWRRSRSAGGSLGATSKEGLRLRQVRRPTVAAMETAEVSSVAAGMAASREPRVLVVDDEDHITELVAMGLGYNGFDVERAATGRAALDAVDKRKPDLIVLDVMLPDLDGFELTR